MIVFLSHDTWQRRLMMAVFLVASVLTIMLNANRGLFSDDDNLWFHLLTYKLVDRPAVAQIEEKMIGIFKDDGAGINQMTRLTDKRDYTYNYLASTALWTAARLGIAPLFTSGQPYDVALGHTMVVEFLFATFVCLALLIGMLWRLKLPLVWWYGLAWFAVVCLLASLMPSPKPPNFMIVNNYLRDAILQFSYFTLDPSYGFSAFSFTGRNNYVLLMLGFFIARWRGHDTFAYAVMALAMTFHASMGMLMLLSVVAIDLLTRPRLLRQTPIASAILLSLIYYFAVESLWQKVGVQALYLAGTGAVLLAAVAYIWPRLNLPAFIAKPQRWVAGLVQRDRAATDLLLFAIGWLVTLPIAVVINHHVDAMQSIYFWSQLHMRIYSVWQPAYLLFFVLWLVGNSTLRGRVALCIVLGIACVSLTHLTVNERFGLYPVKMLPTTSLLESASHGKRDMEAYAKYGVHMHDTCYMPEAMAHYLTVKEVATGEKVIDSYLKKRPKKLPLDCTPS